MAQRSLGDDGAVRLSVRITPSDRAGLVVGWVCMSVILAALLWSSRQLQRSVAITTSPPPSARAALVQPACGGERVGGRI
jgi:hypothetical protein